MKRNCHIREFKILQFSNGTDFTLPGSTEDRYTYAYSYDNFGRLTSSSRYAGPSVSPNNIFTEKNLTYDRNGNMTLDALRNITLTYDINNLVSSVSRNDTILSNYTYLADGTKYKVMQGTESLGSSNSRSGRLYLGPMTYRFEPAGTVPSVTSDMFYLENVDSECGRVVVFRRKTANGQNVTSSFTTLFSVNDHLGSTRAVMDAVGNILERNAYYPFGLQTDQGNDFPNMSSTLTALYPRYINPSATRRDLYNGKEIQSIAGTDYLDYGFRQYDPVTARWMAVDPKAEKYLSMTLYGYCAENPINFIDNIGLKIDDYYDYVTGRYLGTDGASTNNMRIIRDDIFHNIVSNHGGTSKTEEATSELQENSKIITVEREKINNDIITIVDKSYETRIENALYLLLDRENAILTSELSHNRGNTNNRSHINGNWASSTKILLHEKGNNLIVIAQIHGHPKSTSDLITLSGASDFDASGAQKNLIPVYAVDAMKKRKGKQVPIHRANPDGTIDNNIGYTIGMGPFNAFDIARDAMNRR
ncbi:MAG: hypothetical protein IJ855_00825 [Bacteroidales bacterium]|nr:hypothetical protein [Bacteroidales bacterium]